MLIIFCVKERDMANSIDKNDIVDLMFKSLDEDNINDDALIEGHQILVEYNDEVYFVDTCGLREFIKCNYSFPSFDASLHGYMLEHMCKIILDKNYQPQQVSLL